MFSLAHGTNDAQKTMGDHHAGAGRARQPGPSSFDVPDWVIVSSATAIALGTYTGGWRIIRTVGSRIIKMDPAQGFSAQGSGAAVVLAASHLGYPLSTTHVISGGVIGAGAAKRLSAVRWGVAGNIAVAWVMTLPAAAIVGALIYGATRRVRARCDGTARCLDRLRDHADRCARAADPARPEHQCGGRVTVITLASKVVDFATLGKVIEAAVVAGLGSAIVFSVVIWGSTRATDHARGDRHALAAMHAIVATVALGATVAAIVYGISVMTRK